MRLTKKRNVLQDKLSSWASAKAELSSLQRQAYLKEKDTKTEQIRLESNQKMELERKLFDLQEKEISLRLAHAEETQKYENQKHKVELEILNIRKLILLKELGNLSEVRILPRFCRKRNKIST